MHKHQHMEYIDPPWEPLELDKWSLHKHVAQGRQVSLLVGGDNHLLTVRSNWRQSNKIYNNTHYNI
jgi:hypothetical protein